MTVQSKGELRVQAVEPVNCGGGVGIMLQADDVLLFHARFSKEQVLTVPSYGPFRVWPSLLGTLNAERCNFAPGVEVGVMAHDGFRADLYQYIRQILYKVLNHYDALGIRLIGGSRGTVHQ